MHKKITFDDATKFLSDVEPHDCFWVNDGSVIRNLYELLSVIEHLNLRKFEYHVNKTKNDFSVWMKKIVGDEELASQLLKTRKKDETVKKIKKRIQYLENIIDKKQGIEESLSEQKFFVALFKDIKNNYLCFSIGLVLGLLIGILITSIF